MGRGRPPLDLGTYGKITAYEVAPGVWEARCKYRTLNGNIIRPSKRGATEPAAERALKKHITDLAEEAAKGLITRESHLRDVAPLWLAMDIEHEVDEGVLSDGTRRTYSSMIRNHIVPRLGSMRMRELEVSVTACDTLIKDVRTALSYASASTCKTVLDSICAFAIRHGGMTHNPTKSTSKLRKGLEDQVEIKAMERGQIAAMRTGLGLYGRAKKRDDRKARPRAVVWTDLPDISDAMLATGVRIGEVLAISKESVTRDRDGNPAVAIDHHLVRVRGKGLVRKPGRKGNKPGRTLTLPPDFVPMFARRALAAAPGGPLFASVDGTWLDPSNVSNRFRDALDAAGFEWVTSHVWRKTVAKVLDEAGLDIGEVADQLGNTRNVAEKHYVGNKLSNAKAAAAIGEALGKSAGKVPSTG